MRESHSEYWLRLAQPYLDMELAWDYKKAQGKPVADGVTVVDPQTFTLVSLARGSRELRLTE